MSTGDLLELEQSVPTLRDPWYSQSLERGLAILGCFTPEHSVLGITDVADELGMKPSTTHRYMSTLVALGYLERDDTRKYRLTLRVSKLGMSTQSSTSLREHAEDYLQELSRRSSFTVGMAVLDGPEILYVARASSRRRGQRSIDLGLHPGSRLPAYCTAIGKLLLAHLPSVDRNALIGETQLERRAPNTITNRQALRGELAHVRRQDLAINDQELVSELHAMAAPVRSHGGELIAAVSMAAHTSAISLERLVGALGPHLTATADQISARLGDRRADELLSREHRDDLERS